MRASQRRCEYRLNPLGIDGRQPRLSWTLSDGARGDRQTAYQICVGTSQTMLGDGTGDLWDSGKVDTCETHGIRYGGDALRAGQRCWWSVRIWNEKGEASPWSSPNWWEMGLLDESDWIGDWIGNGKALPDETEDFYKEDPAPLFRKTHDVAQPVARARLYITAAGYYEAFINGERVGDLCLDPGWTDYEKRILYSSYDVTGHMQQGNNCLGVTLGNGWYNPLPLTLWGHKNLRNALPVGRPALRAQLHIDYADGTQDVIASDTSWCWHDGPLRRNDIYLGEVFDASHRIPAWNHPEHVAGDWAAAVQVNAPGGTLQAQFQPPVRTTETISPTQITEPEPGVTIVDMGQNFAGSIRLAVKVPRGTRITLRYGELLHADGTLNPLTSICGQIKGTLDSGLPKGGPGAPEYAVQKDVYIASGAANETYTPTFTWHAFRYVELRGCPTPSTPQTITGLRQHADLETVGAFACSNDLFNQIQEITERTFLSNVFSVQSDCPHRERFGYGGDIVVTAEAYLANYDMAQFYTKAVRDWSDAALDDGMLTDTAPDTGIQYCGIGWAIVHPLLLLLLYRHYGETRLIDEQYDCAARWLRLVRETQPSHLVETGLSDHEALEAGDPPIMVTPLYHQSACIMATLAGIRGCEADQNEFQQLADAIADAYTEAFFDSGNDTNPAASQASLSFALYAGLVPDAQKPEALRRLVDDIQQKHNGRLTTGIFGTKYMLDVLSENGYADLAYALATATDEPSWGYMIDQGATTLWEHWAESDDTFSHNHPMFGSISEWFYKHVAGIQVDRDACGSDKVTIHPKLTHKLEWAKASYQSMRGEITSHWYWQGDVLYLDLYIPSGVTATVHLPAQNAAQVMEGDSAVCDVAGVKTLQHEDGKIVLAVQNGEYRFSAPR
ncbi:MAG: alpha-L-rhamnosidase [Kiritimatiellia bacterium]|jgi:alpha-L-rhamnosidase